MTAPADKRSLRGRNGIIFALVAVAWLAIDIATKADFNSYQLGQVIAGPFLGLFQFRLVHNTGAAWGMFGDSTFALGVMSLVVCTALAVYLLAIARRANVAEVVIDTTFIDFPTFNVADIGVTCGFVLFFLGMLWASRAEGKAPAATAASGASAKPGEGE